MLLVNELSIANPNDVDFQIDKFFQVAFIGSPDNLGHRWVDVYSAVVGSSQDSDKLFPSVTITTLVDGTPPDSCKDVITFFERPDLLCQFWDNCKIIRSPEFFKDILLQAEISSLSKIWPKRSTPPLLINDADYKQDAQVLLVIPALVNFSEGNKSITLVCDSGQIVSGGRDIPRIAYGAWVHQRYKAIGNVDEVIFNFEYHLVFTNPVAIKESRIYYCLPSHGDVLEQVARLMYYSSMSFARPDKELGVQVHHLYSQQSTKYFDEWNRLGINSATLLRLNPSAEWAHAFANAPASLDVQLRISDSTAKARADRKAIVASIAISVAISTGIDETRLQAVKPLLPFTGSMQPLFWWIAMALVLIPKYFPPQKVVSRRTSRWLGRATLFAIIAWAFLAFLPTKETQTALSAETWAPRLVIMACAFGLGTAIAQRCTWPVSLASWLKGQFSFNEKG